MAAILPAPGGLATEYTGTLSMTVDASAGTIATADDHLGGNIVTVTGTTVYIPLTAKFKVSVDDKLQASITGLTYSVG